VKTGDTEGHENVDDVEEEADDKGDLTESTRGLKSRLIIETGQ
jgi:hypothetical protein